MSCHLCSRGIMGECDCSEESQTDTQEASLQTGLQANLSPALSGESKLGRTLKANDQITISAGRKRAATLYPIDPNDWCEWRGYKNCGGGLRPVVGCINGKQQHRQHGPVKATWCNDPENIHRICARCHNRWHTLNDPIYDEETYKLLAHQPEIASEEELVNNYLAWNRK